MSSLTDILEFNSRFVEEKEYEPYITTKYPNKKLVVLSCMDSRLVELLPKSMNLRNGDVKIVKSAGAVVNHPFGSIMRSILVALYELNAEEVFIVGHYDCGMSAVDPDIMIEHMKERGIPDKTFDTLKYSSHDIKGWLRGFGDVKTSVLKSCEVVRNHPLLAKTIPVHGLVMDPKTGLLDLLSDGNAYIEQSNKA
ncbi:carbonic anhydrase [Sporosarcina sp. FSL W7-1349]|uniref:beta-class carbonic anhydrase n=1 Tax=Sporosarcina sp. FSL W7-1349 TaxID=2921561 RepID=UPI0030F4FAAA